MAVSIRYVMVALVFVVTEAALGAGGASAQSAECPLPDPSDLAIVVRVNATHATITIPELHLTGSTGEGACYVFQNVRPPRSPMLISFEVAADGYRPSTWKNYAVLFDQPGNGPIFTPMLEQGTEPFVFDPCPDLIAHPQTQSAALHLHAALCARLPDVGMGPGGRPAHYRQVAALLLLGAIAILGGGAALRRSRGPS